MFQHFYHIVLPTSVEYVRKNGITADEEGYIYMLDTKSPEITDTVAFNQLGADEYYVFDIDSQGFSGDLEPDEVAEFTAGHHTRIQQPEIELYYIKELRKRKVDTDRVQRYQSTQTQKIIDAHNKRKKS